MAVVKIKKNLSHVATMAGIAGGYIQRRDCCGHFSAQIDY
jgi:hypothetical protein